MDYAGSRLPRHSRAMVPEVAGMVFAVTLAFMLLFPFIRLSLDGAGEPETLLFLTRTDFGLNIFALILLLVPVAGVAVALTMRGIKALLADTLLAVIGVVMIPLTMLAVGHDVGGNPALASHVAPGLGMIFVSIMLVVIAISSGIATLQARR